jgi:Pyruvate/2-oxoacid:ferredoxin oxidoreductase delta subunit
VGCGLCTKICPNEAIRIEKNLAVIDYAKCDSCGLCATVCPKKLIENRKPKET